MSEDITKWLKALGLGKYVGVFVENDVDLQTLPELTEVDLKELGLSLGHRRALQKAIVSLTKDDRDSSGHPRISLPASEHDTTLAAWERQPGERKPVTMLFADIISSTALTEKLDAEETHDLLYGATHRMCEAVENNRGTVCRFMGDGVMAMFGAPTASEQHALEACEAALEMQMAVRSYAAKALYARDINIRVGLHSGEVVVLTVGEGDKIEYDASGPTVPIAARMEQIAQPGEVYISAATRSLAGHRIEADALDPVSVRGISEQIAVYALRQVRSAEEAVIEIARTPLVGRHTELNQFRGMLDACLAAGQGQTVCVRGEPGIGKTRLVEEFSKVAAKKHIPSYRGLVLPFGVGKGQGAIRSLVRSLLGIATRGDNAERQHAADTAVKEGWLTTHQAVFLNDLLDLPQSTEQRTLYDAMDNAVRNEGKQAVVSNLVTAASKEQPILIIIEDVHWADGITLAHLCRLTKTVTECAALLLITSRIEGDQLDQSWRSGTGGSPITTIDLGPLKRQESMALIEKFMNINDALAETCLERAAGNPLFLEQLLRNAIEGTPEALPDSIQSLVLARMDRLEGEDKRALQAASIIGQRFDVCALDHLLERSDYNCSKLVEDDLLRADGKDYLFAHALIQEAIYGSLLKSKRRVLHLRAAEWFADDPVLHARHLDSADDDKAPHAYLEAARAEAGAYRVESALGLIEQGLAAATKKSDQYALTCLKGELLHTRGEIETSIEAYQAALALADDEISQCRAWIGLAEGMQVSDRYDEARDLSEKAKRAATDHNLTFELARVHHMRGNLYFALGDSAACLKEHAVALEFAREAGSAELEARALGGLGDGEFARQRHGSARGYIKRCLRLCREHALGRIEAAYLCMAAVCRIPFIELREALDDSLAAAEFCERVGHDRAHMLSLSVSVDALLYMGETQRAREYLEAILDTARRLGSRRFEAEFLMQKGRACYLEGRSHEAVEILHDALALCRETSMNYIGPAVLGWLAFTTSDSKERELALREGRELVNAGAMSGNFLDFHCLAMETALKTGDWTDAEQYASDLETFTRPEPLPWSEFFIARARALSDFGRGKRDDATMSEIRRLLDKAERTELKFAVPKLKEAISAG